MKFSLSTKFSTMLASWPNSDGTGGVSGIGGGVGSGGGASGAGGGGGGGSGGGSGGGGGGERDVASLGPSMLFSSKSRVVSVVRRPYSEGIVPV